MVINKSFDICTGCDQIIQDRYLFQVADRKWHSGCLKCVQCKCPLDEKCWVKGDNFYCRKDYFKKFFSCFNCKEVVERNSLVRKVSDLIYHLDCFKCEECYKVLDIGDHFILKENKLICSKHYLTLNNMNQENNSLKFEKNFNLEQESLDSKSSFSNQDLDLFEMSESNLDKSSNSSFNQLNYSIERKTPAFNCNNLSDSNINQQCINGNFNLVPNSMNLVDYSHHHSPSMTYIKNNMKSNIFNTQFYCSTNEGSLPAPDLSLNDNFWTQVNCFSPLSENENINLNKITIRKGRPKKKKIKSDFENFSNVFNDQNMIKLNNSSSSSSSYKQDLDFLQDQQYENHKTNDINQVNQINRIKRNRTSFKPYQIKAMKNYFSRNQNPDAKDLVVLSKETLLTKRILQVWFQNARAKYRKSNLHENTFSQKILMMTT